MVRHEFPELQLLKGFLQSRKAAGLPVWPTVILHVRQHQELRPEIEGPYSLFLNLKGHSRVAAEGQWSLLKDDTYLLTNSQQVYSIAIDSKKEETETFNIHFGDALLSKPCIACCTLLHSCWTIQTHMRPCPCTSLIGPTIGTKPLMS